jgi:peptide/nickel transport system substrate-binding protein
MKMNNYFVLLFFSSIILLIFSLLGCIENWTGDKTIKIALGSPQPTSIDPSNFASADPISRNVFEALVYFDKNGELKPRLATSWSFSDDNKVLTMQLRKNVLFSSGAPFTSKDVVFSLNRNKLTNMGIQDQLAKHFNQVEAVDDYTVKFIFNEPNAQFLYQTCELLYIISEADINKAGEKAFVQNPIGTGPYKFAEWKAGQYIDMVVNDKYWGDKSHVKEGRVVFAQDDNTRVNMLKAGEVDMITNPPWESIDSLKKSGFNITKSPRANSIALTFSLINKGTPWSDGRVRQAINYCIDKDAIITKLCYGVPEKLEWMFGWELGFDPSLQSAYPYNPQKAKQLMIEAGYPNGFEMQVIYTPNVSNLKNVVDYITVSLKQIGINCNLIGLNLGPEFFGKIRSLHEDPEAKAVAIWEIGGPGNPDPIMNLTSQYYSGKASGLYNTLELDAIIEKGLSTIDNKERKKLIQEAYRIIDKDLPVIHIFRSANVFVTKQNLIYTPLSGPQSTYSILPDIQIKRTSPQ